MLKLQKRIYGNNNKFRYNYRKYIKCFRDVWSYFSLHFNYDRISITIISLIFTIIGCIISYTIFSKKIGSWFNKKIKDKETLNKLVLRFKNIHFTSLTVIIAMPFTPAFLVNIAAGLVKMNKKKFIFSLIIGKAIMVYFWGYIGTSLIKSITNPIILLRIFALLAVAYILSKLINKKLKLD